MSFGNTNTDIWIAGACAAFTVDLLVYPLDTIKTRIQSPDYRRLYTNLQTGAVQRSLFRGLYQGVGSVILATVPSSGAFFTTYEAVKAGITRAGSQNGRKVVPEPLVNAAASSVGEMVSCLILTPAEVLKQNAQMVRKNPDETSKAFDGNATVKTLRKFNRPSQLWRGYTALVARNLPFTAMQFPVFEHLKKMALEYHEKSGKKTDSLLEKAALTGVAAGTAGSVAAVITTPIDVVKTRIMLSAADDISAHEVKKQVQLQGKDADKEFEKAKRLRQQGRSSALGVARHVFKTEGVQVLFTGGALRGIWTFLGSGLYLGVYESGRTYLENLRAQK